MRNLNLDQIQTLIAIADLGTFAAASQALHLAPPTISLHIKELEARMVPLVLRGRRQAGLTAAGQALVEEGRKLLAASDDLVDIVPPRRRQRGRGEGGRVGRRRHPPAAARAGGLGAARARRGRETGSGGFG